MSKTLKTKLKNTAAAIGGSLLLSVSPVVLSNCTTAGSQGSSAPSSRVTLWDEMQGGHDLKNYLEKHNETYVLKDYKHGASGYWIVLQREIIALKKDHPKYSNFDATMMHREITDKGLNYYRELQDYIEDKFKTKRLPEDVDSVTEYVEWKKSQASRISSH